MSFRKTGKGLLLLASILLLIPGSFAQDKILLKFSPAKGKSYNIKVTSVQKITQTVQDKESVINQTFGMDMVYDVLDVGQNGGFTIKVTYKAVKMVQDGPGGRIDYDSSNPPAVLPTGAEGLAGLLGQSIILKMDSQGKVVEIQGVDALMANLSEKTGASPAAKMVMANLKEQFGDEAIKETYGNMVCFPDSPVGPGDSWTQKLPITKPFPMVVENVYKLSGRQNGIASLETKATLKTNEDIPPLDMGDFKMKFNLNGTIEGTVNLDENTGFPVESKLFQKIAGQIELSKKPGAGDVQPAPAVMKIPFLIESAITMETSEIKN